MSAPFVLTPSPLSQGFRVRLERDLGDGVEYLSIPELRRLPLRQLVRELRARVDRPCVIAYEDPASTALLPVLHTLALLARPSAISVLDPSLDLVPLPATRLVGELGRFAGAVADGALAARGGRRELQRLLATARMDVDAAHGRRAAYVNANLWFGVKAGGSVGHVAGVVNGFGMHGYDVDLFSVSEPVLVDPSVRVVPLRPPEVLGLPLELNFPRFQRGAVRQIAAGARTPYDFVYQRLSTATFTGVEASRRLRAPLVLEYNGSEAWIARNWGRPLRFERYALDAEEASLRHAHLVVTISRVLRDEVVERGVDPEHVVWYPNCVDERLYDPGRFTARETHALRRRYGIPDDAVVVTFVGTFGRWHGAEVLARAIAQLAADRAWVARMRPHFLLVGDGLRMNEVQAALGELAASDLVALPGLVPQAEGPIHLAASDVLVSPHVRNEDGTPFFGSPTKLFEYMAMGKGIVASALDQIADVLDLALRAAELPAELPGDADPRLAVLTAPGSVAELAAGIRFLVDRPEWRRILGENARAEALAKYTWKRHVGVVLDALAASLDGGRRP